MHRPVPHGLSLIITRQRAEPGGLLRIKRAYTPGVFKGDNLVAGEVYRQGCRHPPERLPRRWLARCGSYPSREPEPVAPWEQRRYPGRSPTKATISSPSKERDYSLDWSLQATAGAIGGFTEHERESVVSLQCRRYPDRCSF